MLMVLMGMPVILMVEMVLLFPVAGGFDAGKGITPGHVRDHSDVEGGRHGNREVWHPRLGCGYGALHQLGRALEVHA